MRRKASYAPQEVSDFVYDKWLLLLRPVMVRFYGFCMKEPVASFLSYVPNEWHSSSTCINQTKVKRIIVFETVSLWRRFRDASGPVVNFSFELDAENVICEFMVD